MNHYSLGIGQPSIPLASPLESGPRLTSPNQQGLIDLSEVKVLSPTYPASKNVVLKRFVSGVPDYTVSASATASFTKEIGGMEMLKVVTAAGTLAEVEITNLNILPPINGDFVFQIYTRDVFSCTALRVLVSQGNYTGWADLNILLTVSAPPFREKNGWQIYTVSAQSKTNGGTGFDFATNTCDRMKIRISPAAGKIGTFFVHSFQLRAKNAPRFAVGFDDGRDGIFVKKATVSLGGDVGPWSIRDICRYYGIKPTLWVVTSVIGMPGHITWGQLRQLVSEGWDVQAQIDMNMRSLDSKGAALLGPTGYAVRLPTSVDTVADTITGPTTNLQTLNSSDVSGNCIEFVGTLLPAPLVVGVPYWATPTSTTAFQVFATEYDSIIGSPAIDLTTAGTAGSFGWRYVGSAPDHTAILADLLRHLDIIERQTGVRPTHVAPNQGCADVYVNRAYELAGMKLVRTVAPPITHDYWAQFPSEDIGPCWPRNQTMAIQTDNPATVQATIESQVDDVINTGSIGYSYHHDLDTPTGTVLNYLLSYLRRKADANLIRLVQPRDL